MRKVLSIVLVLALVLGSTAFSFGAVPSDVAGSKYEDAVNVLMELDVISGYPDGSYKPAGIVTRGEMAKIIICALGLEEYVGGASGFSDMAGHWSDKYVAYAASLGIINGYPDGTFKPDNTVSYDEAAKMLVAALGYTEDALIGSWPANWVVKARALGILDGVKAGPAGANRGDIALMAFNNLGNNLGYVNKDGEWVDNAPPETMLDRLGAEIYDPTTYGIGAIIPDPTKDEFVVRGDEDSVINLKPYVGALVAAYSNSDDEIIAIKEIKSVFLTGNFGADIPSGVSIPANNEFSAEKDYTVKSAIPTAGIGFFVNGIFDQLAEFSAGAVGKEVADSGVDYKIAASVSGTKITDIYSISEWKATASKQVGTADIAKIDKDHTLLTKVFEEDDNEDIDLTSFELVGVNSLDEIKKDDVVFVYDNGTITKVEVSDKVVTGEVTRIKGGNKYTIEGAEYKFTGVAGSPALTALKVGNEVKAWIGPDGKIYDYELISGEKGLYGIVLRTGIASEDTSVIGATDAKLELFLADGTKKEFVVDYDAIGTADIPATVYNKVPTPDVWLLAAGDLIEYDLNKDGEIKKIDWIVDAGANGAAATVVRAADTTKVATPKDFSSSGYYTSWKVADDALVLTYDTAGFTTDADKYGVANVAGLRGTELPANAFYVLDGNAIVLMYIADDAEGESVYAVVIDSEENDSDNEYGVTLLVDGDKVEKDSDFDATGFVKTDFDKLYKVVYKADGTVKDLQDVATLAVAGGVYHTAKAGAAVDVDGNVLEVTGGYALLDNAVTTETKLTLIGDPTVYKWNTKDGVYEAVNIADIDGKTDVILFDTLDDGVTIFNIVLVGGGGY